MILPTTEEAVQAEQAKQPFIPSPSIPFEEEYPEEAQTLMAICAERAKKRKAGKRLKPLTLDIPDPAISTKINRNAPCPCGSGKKFKKCCIHIKK